MSDDGKTYSFTLREGVVFSDGTPLTANDVRFTFERILTLKDSAQTDYAIVIDGAIIQSCVPTIIRMKM